MSRDCPACKLTNPPDALRCDCGYSFTSPGQPRSQPQPRRGKAVWAASLLAFGQGAFTGVMALLGVPPFNVFSLTDTTCLSGFGIALLRGRTWGGWALLAYSGLDAVTKLTVGTTPWVIPPLVYLVGAVSRSRSGGAHPQWDELPWRRALLFGVLIFLFVNVIGFVGGASDLGRRDDWAAISWGAFAIGTPLLVAFGLKMISRWRFETALLMASAYWALAATDVLFGANTTIVWLSSLAIATALTLIGLVISRVLPAPRPDVDGDNVRLAWQLAAVQSLVTVVASLVLPESSASLADAVIIAALAFAAYRQYRWAVWGLATYQGLSLILFKIIRGYLATQVAGGFFVVYLLAAIELERRQRRERVKELPTASVP